MHVPTHFIFNINYEMNYAIRIYNMCASIYVYLRLHYHIIWYWRKWLKEYKQILFHFYGFLFSISLVFLFVVVVVFSAPGFFPLAVSSSFFSISHQIYKYVLPSVFYLCMDTATIRAHRRASKSLCCVYEFCGHKVNIPIHTLWIHYWYTKCIKKNKYTFCSLFEPV